MAVLQPLLISCPVCKEEFNWHTGFGRECRCCSKDCHKEFTLRYCRSLGVRMIEQPKQEPAS